MEWEENIIKYIKKNRVSTTEIADCLDKTGSIEKVEALNARHHKVGKVHWVFAYGGSNWNVHEQVQSVQEGDIVLIETFECGDKAIFGELVAKYLVLYKQAEAIVVTGAIRDVNNLIKENWPIWHIGRNPVGCINTEVEVTKSVQLILNERKSFFEGSIAVCDDTGVVIIPKSKINEEFYRRLEQIEYQEDIWFDCLDRLKMSTYEIVCQKKYLNFDK